MVGSRRAHRVITLIDAVEQALDGWTPPPALENETRGALVAHVNNAATTARRPSTEWALLQRLGSGSHDPLTRAATRVLLSLDLEEDNPDLSALLARTCDNDRLTAQLALRWWATSRRTPATRAHRSPLPPERSP